MAALCSLPRPQALPRLRRVRVRHGRPGAGQGRCPAIPLVTQQTQGTSRQKLYAIRKRILRRMCRESPYEPADVVRLHGARVGL